MQDVKKALDIIDAMGKPCPMPLLMLKKALKNAPIPSKRKTFFGFDIILFIIFII